MTAPLKPCPFCGGEATLVTPASGAMPYVCCRSNFCTAPKATSGQAIEAWNRRSDAPELLALVGLLAEARTDLAAYVDADWPEHQRSNYPPIQAKWKRDMALCWQIDVALAAWEAIAPKPATVTAPGMHPEDMPLERPTPLHTGGKARDDA